MKDNIDWEKANKIVGQGLYSGLAKVMVDVSHRNLANFGNKHSKEGATILEIGTGRGEHFNFVRNDFKEYVLSDISSWGRSEIEEILKTDVRTSFKLENIESLTFSDNTFDRVIVSCVLIHVDQPFLALEELKRVTKKGGVISLYIAADPGIVLRSMRHLVSKRKMKDLEVPYSVINALSHRNSAPGLILIAKHVFSDSRLRVSYYPFRIKSWNLSTHMIVNIILD